MVMPLHFTSVLEVLLSHNVPLPPNILLTAIRQGSTLEMVEYLIQGGADACATTSDGDTVLHLALRARYSYGEETCCKLVKSLINAGCNTTARDSTGQTALGMVLERYFTSVVETLLSYNVPLPPNALLIAIRQGSTLEMVKYLIHRGADARATTSDGDTVLHLALHAGCYYAEVTCCKLVQTLVNAGCDPYARNSKGNTVLLAAIECGYSSVVDLLLSFNVPVPLDILHTALQRKCKPRIIYVLACKGADNHIFECVSGSDWDTLLQLAFTAYSGRDSQQVTRILESGRKAYRTRPDLGDETCMHVAKRSRLKEWE